MKIIIQKPDLDTCMTALLLGVTKTDKVSISRGDAPYEDIMNPDIICIETGGSGLVYLNNFDHHDTNMNLFPASIQAIRRLEIKDKKLTRLADYISIVDVGGELKTSISFPSLSNIFSGMRLVEHDLLKQFFKGIELLQDVVKNNYNPFKTMPEKKEWLEYIKAKNENWKMVKQDIKKTKFFFTKNAKKVGFCVQKNIGGFGALFDMGCSIGMLYHPCFGENKIPTCTIASSKINLSVLLSALNGKEPGWGGHSKIIGSPRKHGTKLSIIELIAIVKNYM